MLNLVNTLSNQFEQCQQLYEQHFILFIGFNAFFLQASHLFAKLFSGSFVSEGNQINKMLTKKLL